MRVMTGSNSINSVSSKDNISIAIVGNCQVRPLAEILSACTQVNADIAQIIVHLSSNDSAQEHMALLENADLILSQLVAGNYPVAHVTTQHLKEHFTDKVVVWPNVFFHGQNPDLFYASGEQNTRVFGPLDVYHSRALIELWKQGVPPEEVQAENYIPSVYSDNAIAEQVDRSFHDLAQREVHTDIKMCDYIKAHWQTKKLFHTFNHPTSHTIKALAAQIIDYLGIGDNGDSCIDKEYNDWLGTIQPPVEKYMAQQLGLQYDVGTEIAGVELQGNESVIPGQYRSYTFNEFVAAAFDCYNAQRSTMNAVRFTPASQI